MSTKKIKLLFSIITALFLVSLAVPLLQAEEDEYYVLNIGTGQLPDVLNPFTTTAAASGTVIEKMYETMFFVTEHGEYKPLLAERWEVSDDAKEFIYYLHNNITWSDGKPLTADDVKFTFEMLMEHDLEPSTTREIVKVEALDEYTVKFTTNNSFVPFLLRSGGDIYIMPKHIWENIDDPIAYTNNEAPMGCGPWIWDKWIEDEYVTLKKNPNYWRGDVLIDELNIILYRSEDAEVLALKSKEIDLMGINPNQVGTFVGTPDVGINQFNEYRLCYFGYNLRRFPFSEKAVRHAMAWAIDRKDIVDNAYQGYGTIGYDGYVSPMLSYYINPATEWKGLGMTDEERYEKARELLDNAGIIDRDSDGVREDAEGNKCEANLLVSATSSTFMRWSEVIKNDLEAIGIKITLEPREIGAIIDDVYGLGVPYDPDFDCYIMTCGYIQDPDYLYMEYFSSPHVMGWNGYSGGYSNPELDELLILQRTTGDLEKRREYVFEIQEIIAEDLPALNVRNNVVLQAYRTDQYKGWPLGEFFNAGYNLQQLKPVGPEVIVETEIETVTETVEVEKVPSWVYPTTGLLGVVAVGAILYTLMRRKE